MIETQGNNQFVDNMYDADTWSAPILHMPEEVTQFLRNTSIAGRRIEHIYSIGPAYNMSLEWMQNFAIILSQQEGEKDNFIPPLIDFIPPETVFSRLILVDQPIIIQFDSGDRLEVLFAHGSEVRLSINKLPMDLTSPNGERNINTDIMFSEVIGKTITGIQIGRRKSLPEDWEPPHGEDWKEQDALIAFLLFETSGEAGMAFEPYKETGRVFLVGKDRKIRPILFGQLKEILTLAPLGDDGLEIYKYDEDNNASQD